MFKFALLAAAAVALPTAKIVPDQYIVSFTSDIARDPNAELPHYRWLDEMLSNMNERSDHYGVLHRYNVGDLYKGYSVRVPPSLAKIIAEMPNIAYVEPDALISVESVQPKSPSWGLTRIAQRALPLVSNYTYPDKAGEGVTVYVIDTGINTKHPDFAGRAVVGTTFSTDGAEDGHGHGTHCAGTVGSNSYGVAKKAKLVGVKVLDNSGSGSYSSVIAGINWVAGNATGENIVGKAVASMSLGGGKSQAVNDAVAAAVKSGVPFVAAAGNSYKANACDFSPASEPLAITVAASDKTDTLARFSNVGPCVDIIAPGVDITSTWLGVKNNTISGTSMAAPHVAGVVALILAEKQVTADELAKLIVSHATPDVVKGVPANTVNKLLFNGVDTYPTTQNVDPDLQTEYPVEEGELPLPDITVPAVPETEKPETEKPEPVSDGINRYIKEYLLQDKVIQSYDFSDSTQQQDVPAQQQGVPAQQQGVPAQQQQVPAQQQESQQNDWWTKLYQDDQQVPSQQQDVPAQQQQVLSKPAQQQQQGAKNWWEFSVDETQQQEVPSQQQQVPSKPAQQQQEVPAQQQSQQQQAPVQQKPKASNWWRSAVKAGEIPVDTPQQVPSQQQHVPSQQQQVPSQQQQQGFRKALKGELPVAKEIEIPVQEFPEQESNSRYHRYSVIERAASALHKASKDEPKPKEPETDPLGPYNPEYPVVDESL